MSDLENLREKQTGDGYEIRPPETSESVTVTQSSINQLNNRDLIPANDTLVDWATISTADQLIKNITVTNSGDIMPTSDELTDAKIATAEARTDTKIVRMEGKMDILLSEIRATKEKVESESKTTRELVAESRRTTWTVGLTVAGIIVSVMIGVITILPDFFDMGKSFQKAVFNAIHQTPSKK